MKPEWIKQLERDGVNRHWSFQHPELSSKKGAPFYVCGICDRIEHSGQDESGLSDLPDFTLTIRGSSGAVAVVSMLNSHAQSFETEKEALEDAAMKNKARCITK